MDSNECESCGQVFLGTGSSKVLKVKVGQQGGQTNTSYLCHDCRLEHYTNYPEPLPLTVTNFHKGGRQITPLLTKDEARRLYCLTSEDMRGLQFETGRPTVGAANRDATLLVPQHQALLKAREVHGGDIGIHHARLQWQRVGREVLDDSNTPPDLLDRRAIVRTFFIQKGYFPAEDVDDIRRYIVEGDGEPFLLRDEYAL
ncbi:hypothetical protein BGX29_001894 [Mortierella sp. GBA35]|nr:hypothetical protein BGX29_001894 [Mortierella sp. GBA35]